MEGIAQTLSAERCMSATALLNMAKKFPPFGKKLKERMLKGYQPRNGVNVYTSWDMGRVIPHGVTFPPETDPNEFDWTFLAGQRISLINTGGYAEYETLKELAILLVKSGVMHVGLIDIDHPLQWYIPEVKEVAA